MAIVVPTPVPALATDLPDLSDRTTYPTRGEAVLDWETTQLVPGSETISGQSYDNAQHALAAATLARASSSFVGPWSALTGALAVPAAASHSGKLWILLDSVADVTAAEPGVSSAWGDATVMRRTGGTMLGPLAAIAGGTGSQVPRAEACFPRVSGAARLPSWTTAGRPGAPTAGDTGFNTTLGKRETYNGTDWVPSGSTTITDSTIGSGEKITTGIPPWVKAFRLSISVGFLSSDRLRIRLGSSAGMEATGYLGMTVHHTASATSGGANLSAGFDAAVASTEQHYGNLEFTNVTSFWCCRGSFGSASGVQKIAGRKQVTGGTFDRISLSAISSSNFLASSWTITY